MRKTLENKFFNILSSLDSIWAKITIIGIFVCTGLKFGCYYKETQMKLEQLEEEKKLLAACGMQDLIAVSIVVLDALVSKLPANYINRYCPYLLDKGFKLFL